MPVSEEKEVKPLSHSDVMDIFNNNDESDKPSDAKKEEDKSSDSIKLTEPSEDENENEEESEESDEQDEEESEDEKPLKIGDDESDEDELGLINIPRLEEIKAKYPNFLKEFPSIRSVMFRERAYNEIFPTVNEAKDAKSRLNDYNAFESELLSGNIKGVLSSIKKSDEGAYNKIVNSYIETLASLDPAANLKVANKVTRGMLRVVNNLANQLDGDNKEQLQIAVKLVTRAIYGSPEIPNDDISQKEEKEDPERKKLDEDKNNFERTKFESAYSDVSSRVESMIKRAVTDNVDIKNSLPSYVKGKLVDDVMSTLDKHLDSDERFKGLLKNLWKDSNKESYNSKSKDRIVKAIKLKVETVLLPIIRAKRQEAIKGLGIRVKREEKPEKSERLNTGGRSEEKLTNSNKRSSALEMKPGESARDFLLRD